MSPGRCALPSGMFSTRPIAPTALTLALRAASACIRPTTQAAPAMSPFMSSMPAAGLIEMPPVSKHTPLPMKATGASPFLPPFQRMTTMRLSRARALADAEQRVHAELLHRLDVEHLDRDAELLQRRGAAGEFLRIEHVGRLVDQVARHACTPSATGLRARPGLARGGRVGDARSSTLTLRLGRRRPPCAWSCSDRTHRRAAARRARAPPPGRASARRRQIRRRSWPRAPRRDLAHRDAAELDEILAP